MQPNSKPYLPARSVRTVIPKGFTLVELMVTVLVVAILAGIAIPSYSHYTLKAHRTEAKSALLDLASLEERYFSVNNTYSVTPSDMGYPGTSPFSDGSTTVTIGSGYYQITAWDVTAAAVPTALLPGGTPAQYTITVSAVGNQTNDAECAKFTINQMGQQTSVNSSGTATTDCW